MDGITKITARIAAEAASEAAGCLREAEARAREIAAEYSKTAEEEYRRVTEKGAAEAAALARRLDSAAELNAKKELLSAKQELVSLAFDMAAQQLCSLAEDRYAALLTKLAAEAARTGSEELVFSRSDKAGIGEKIRADANAALRAAGRPAALTTAERTADIDGGFILSGGDIEVNCSASALVRQYTNELTSGVASVLFG
jgi:V/A-type H+-transporting ATPase subunit E